MRLSIVIPAYNEERNILKTLKAVTDYLNRQDFTAEIIIVDDGSRDRTVEIIKQHQAEWQNVRLIESDKNRGKGAAVQRGVQAAQGEFIVFMDADNATRIDEVDQAWTHLAQPKTVVIGSRHLPESAIIVAQPLARKILGRLGNVMIRLLLLPGIRDTQCGFKCFRAEEGQWLFSELDTLRWGFDFEVLARARHAGFRVIEIPVEWRNSDESRVGKGAAVKTLKELLRIRRLRKNWPTDIKKSSDNK